MSAVDPNAHNPDSMVDENGKKRTDSRRLTAMSDWGTLPASVKAQLDRKATMWILEAPTRPIEEVYTIGAQIGQPGQFGRAHRCVHKETGAERAVKVISKTKFTRAADKKVHFKELRLEIDILQKMNHDNIIKLHDVFETINDLYIVMDLCDGGELFDRIKAQPAGSYSEKDAQQVLRQICIGLSYLHRFRIAHCDLKPDNFLFSGGATDTLKIIDFGMSKWVKRRQYFHSLRGTPYYIAPEVIKGQYNESCDMWSFGVVMFVMLFGYPPFHADADQEIFRQVLEGFQPIVKKGYKAHFPLAIACSDAAKDLIAKLLTSDTAKRLTADEALAHPWLTGEAAASTPMVLDVLTNLKNFSAHSKFKQDILNLMVNTLTEADLQKLKKLFTDIDTDGNGHITIAELTAAVEKSNNVAAQFVGSGGEASPASPISKFTPQELQRILEAADMDGDGTLSYHELVLTTVQRRLSAKEERLWIAFSKIDLNRDGLLTVEERQTTSQPEGDNHERPAPPRGREQRMLTALCSVVLLLSCPSSGTSIARRPVSFACELSPDVSFSRSPSSFCAQSSVLGEDLAEASQMIKSVDKNGDGLIDFDEFLDLWLKREEDEDSEVAAAMAKLTEKPDLPPGAKPAPKQ